MGGRAENVVSPFGPVTAAAPAIGDGSAAACVQLFVPGL